MVEIQCPHCEEEVDWKTTPSVYLIVRTVMSPSSMNLRFLMRGIPMHQVCQLFLKINFR